MSLITTSPEGFDVKAFLKSLTARPGVYQMYNAEGEILYVGKAKNLKNRVASYFHKSGLSPKTQSLVDKIRHIEVTVTPSETEALVLEQNLIKSQRPPFNILLRDDKSYPYIFVSSAQEFPRISLHRGGKNPKNGRYYGPFPNVGAVRETLKFLQKTFRVRQCEDSVFSHRHRPCLQYQIKRCTAPCVDYISKHDYLQDVRHSEMLLQGKDKAVVQELANEMERFSHQLAFEEAAVCRDQIVALRAIQSQQIIEDGRGDIDVIAVAKEADMVCVHVLYIRQGRILGSKSYFPTLRLVHNEKELLNAFLPMLYLGSRSRDIPDEIITDQPVDDEAVFIDAVFQELGRAIRIHPSVRGHHVRGHRAKWLKLSSTSAHENLRAHLAGKQTLYRRYESLQEVLSLDQLPVRIECFDISHSSGELTVASCVVFDHTGPVKSDYRRFNIDGITPGDDYAAMEQALLRRYTRLQKGEGKLPDLLLIDGGKGQVHKAQDVLSELGINDIYLVGVAKGATRKPGFETLYLDSQKLERLLASDSPALHLIQQVRDEAHRFAITGHQQRRDKRRRTSSLEMIPGIGPKRRRELLRYFGGLQEIERASQDDLAKVPGISKKMAKDIYMALHSR